MFREKDVWGNSHLKPLEFWHRFLPFPWNHFFGFLWNCFSQNLLSFSHGRHCSSFSYYSSNVAVPSGSIFSPLFLPLAALPSQWWAYTLTRPKYSCMVAASLSSLACFHMYVLTILRLSYVWTYLSPSPSPSLLFCICFLVTGSNSQSCPARDFRVIRGFSPLYPLSLQ